MFAGLGALALGATALAAPPVALPGTWKKVAVVNAFRAAPFRDATLWWSDGLFCVGQEDGPSPEEPPQTMRCVDPRTRRWSEPRPYEAFHEDPGLELACERSREGGEGATVCGTPGCARLTAADELLAVLLGPAALVVNKKGGLETLRCLGREDDARGPIEADELSAVMARSPGSRVLLGRRLLLGDGAGKVGVAPLAHPEKLSELVGPRREPGAWLMLLASPDERFIAGVWQLRGKDTRELWLLDFEAAPAADAGR